MSSFACTTNYLTIKKNSSCSFYWGAEVFRNIGHVTTSGVVASWWFEPNRTNVVGSSLARATTTSLGSIAFGSLIVAVIQALKTIVDSSRKNGGQNNFFSCIASCILACLRDMAEYFNRWAFVYVGIYGTRCVHAETSSEPSESHQLTHILHPFPP